MSTLLESRLSPQQREQACAADAAEMAAEMAMRNLRRAQAVRATLNTAGQAINAAMRPCFDQATQTYFGLCGDLRAEADDEGMTFSQAHELATSEVLSYAESVADWIAQECDTPAGREPLNALMLEPLQIIEGAPSVLMVAIMTGNNTQVIRAVHRLRELAGKHFAAEIGLRADEVMDAAL